MSEFINRDRRTFMANDVVTVAAAQFLFLSRARAWRSSLACRCGIFD